MLQRSIDTRTGSVPVPLACFSRKVLLQCEGFSTLVQSVRVNKSRNETSNYVMRGSAFVAQGHCSSQAVTQTSLARAKPPPKRIKTNSCAISVSVLQKWLDFLGKILLKLLGIRCMYSLSFQSLLGYRTRGSVPVTLIRF